jgi:tetratricopeptide (TPR) repeat protein
MSGRQWLLLSLIIVAGAGLIIATFGSKRPQTAPSPPATTATGYVPSMACAGCHRETWERFSRTGMGRSMQPASASVMPSGFAERHTSYHRASDRHYTLLERNGKFYQRRHQIGPGGREENVFEREIHYVVGSGNHAKTFLHRNADGRLMELPLAWYAEGGGTWAMNPGYDHPSHPDFRREIPLECMFCHNAYPAMDPGADRAGSEPVFPTQLPTGIDCQRCHGPGQEHIQAAGGGNLERIRKAIVNPARLSTERQLDICMQCHLETTSARLPNSILRWERGVFSFRPGEPLGGYAVYFDHSPGSGRDDKFEIASQAYRFRKSACFTKSAGKLTCTTCHDPHDRPSAERAIQACKTCHPSVDRVARHPQAANCVGCHMQKRRTDDVVHVVMTDHFIQRTPPRGDPLAMRRERAETEEDAYQGAVSLYYPSKLEPGPESELYLAVAQVKQFSNIGEGVPRLASLIEQFKPANGLIYFELAKAYDRLGRPADALRHYEAAVNRAPDFRPARIGLAQAYAEIGSLDRAVGILRIAVGKDPKDAAGWNSLGLAQLQQGRPADAIAAFRKAIEARPEYVEAYNNLAGALGQSGDRSGSAEMYRAALRLQPDLTETHLALGRMAENLPDADYHFKAAIFYRPNDARPHYEYGLALAGADRYREAAGEFRAAARLKPTLAEAHASLGDMLAMQNQPAQAIPHYRRALSLRPDLESARTGLEMVTRQKR